MSAVRPRIAPRNPSNRKIAATRGRRDTPMERSKMLRTTGCRLSIGLLLARFDRELQMATLHPGSFSRRSFVLGASAAAAVGAAGAGYLAGYRSARECEV